MTHKIILDLECIPSQDPQAIAALKADMMEQFEADMASIKAPSNYKDQAKIDEFVSTAKNKIRTEFDDNLAKAYHSMCFEGGTGQIVALCFTFDDELPIQLFPRDTSMRGEANLIASFFELLTRRHKAGSQFIGHNILGFDLPYIWKRAIVHSIKPPPFFPHDPKPWDDVVYDTSIKWGGFKDRVKLVKLCRMLGVPSPKDDLCGADVWPAIQRGEFERVADYCSQDVIATRACFKRMTFA